MVDAQSYQLSCRYTSGARRWSFAFLHLFRMAHAHTKASSTFQVPSEHTQEGKRYDAEMQLFHFYSVSAEEAGVANQMASLSIFMEAYDNAPDYDMLNKVICQWRRVEDDTREQCGLPSVTSFYPGCFYYRRGHDDGNRNLRKTSDSVKAKSIHDVLLEKSKVAAGNPESDAWNMDVEDSFEEPEDFDWDEFIRDVYRQEEMRTHGRHLIDYDHIGPWHNYFGMLGVKTEYYYRYSG